MRSAEIQDQAPVYRVDLTEYERLSVERIEQDKPLMFDAIYMPAIVGSALRKLHAAGYQNTKAEHWLSLTYAERH